MSEEKLPVESDETSPVEARGQSVGVINERKLLRKIDLRILPGLGVLLLLSFLDQGNVGNARIEGLLADTHMTGNQFPTALAAFYAGGILFLVPCTLVLKFTSPRFWLPTLTLVWGIICTLTGLTQSFAGFVTARVFLGIAQSGYFSGVAFYLSMWYKRNEQLYRLALIISTVSIGGAFGGLFAFALAKMKGIAGLGGWRWIFIIEGLLTVVIAVAAYFFICNYPGTGKFLTTEEKEQVLARLKHDSDATRDEKFTWEGVIQALKDPKIYLYGLCYHTIILPGVTLSYFLPTIINDFGYTAATTQLLTIAPYFAASVLNVSVAVLAERTKRRAPFIIAGDIVGIVGYTVLLTSRLPGLSYAGTILVLAGTSPALVITMSLPGNNVSGQTKRMTASAMQLAIGSLAVIIGMQLYRPQWSPRNFVGNGTSVGYVAGNLVFTSILWYMLKRENERRDRGERDDRLKDVDKGVFLGDDDPRWRFQL